MNILLGFLCKAFVCESLIQKQKTFGDDVLEIYFVLIKIQESILQQPCNTHTIPTISANL